MKVEPKLGAQLIVKVTLQELSTKLAFHIVQCATSEWIGSSPGNYCHHRRQTSVGLLPFKGRVPSRAGATVCNSRRVSPTHPYRSFRGAQVTCEIMIGYMILLIVD